MKDNIQLSIIVPVYNVEEYLPRCLESIANQTFKDFECILVDDGSPDKSGEICDDFAQKDSRFRVIHQKNAGVGAARNVGLNEAKGEWIGFVDSDDWIDEEMFHFLRNHLCGHDVISSDIFIDDFQSKSFLLKNQLWQNKKDNILGLLKGSVQVFFAWKTFSPKSNYR